MALICTHRHDPKLFGQFESGYYTVEASTLEDGGRGFYGRLWDDSIDEGFVIHSERLKKDFIFVLHKVEEKEGEVVAWRFKSFPPSVNNAQMTAVVFND